MRRLSITVLLLLCVARPSNADEPVVVVANLAFHSAFWPNLHHALYGAAWARRPKTGARRLMPDLPAPLTTTLFGEERAAWEAAVDYYDRTLADRDLLGDLGMMRIKIALAAEDLASEAIGAELRAVLERVAPIYRQRFWAAHDRSNREWIQETVERLRTIEKEIASAQERMYGRAWFDAPVRVDIVWIGRAYTSLFPTHATVSPAEGPLTGWTSVEMVLHEVSHELILLDAAGARQRLWRSLEAARCAVARRAVLHDRPRTRTDSGGARDRVPEVSRFGRPVRSRVAAISQADRGEFRALRAR
jgi:hypothetical protein